MIATLTRYRINVNLDLIWTEEAHAELIYAEVQVMLTMLSFGEQNSIVSLIRGAFRLRAANNAYKLTADIRDKKYNWTSATARREFDAGVCSGTGVINLVRSFLVIAIDHLTN